MTLGAVVAAASRPPGTVWALDTLQVALLLLVAAGATVVVLTRSPVRQVVVLGFYGLFLSMLFFSLQAPDVTLSEITVGSVILPLLLLLALAKLRSPQQ
jgi:energy-converting hydrogenase B subunit D